METTAVERTTTTMNESISSWLGGVALTMPEPTPKTAAYYRSKAFVSTIGVNPLIAAAAPLFFLVEKIQNLTTTPNLTQLRTDLLHEVKAFETQAQQHGYRSKMLIAARYVLCTWVDELISRTTWGRDLTWQLQTLVEQPTADIKENRSFFLVLNHCLQDPSTYVDLLELLYLCLSLGFEGEYRYLERGYILLAELRDNLYHTIQRHRGEASKQLEIHTPQVPITEKILPRLIARVSFIAALAVISVMTYLLSNYHLNHSLQATTTLLQPLSFSGEEHP